MTVAIVGSRRYPQLEKVRTYVAGLPPDTTVVSGGAQGVDIVAELAARKRGLAVRIFYPDWKKFGKSAGFQRNRLIVEAADKVVAFWDGMSAGTQDSINWATELGKELEVIQ